MLNPHNHPSLLRHSVHGTTLTLSSSDLGPNHSEEDPFRNSYGVIDSTLLPSQNQVFPVLGQMVSHHHMGEARNSSTNPVTPTGFYAHCTSDSYTLQPQNTVTLNLIVENNSSININLIRSKPSSHLARNNPFAPSSSTPNNPESSNFQQSFLTLDSYQESIMNRIPETQECSQFTRHHSQHASPVDSTVSEMALSTLDGPTAIPCLIRQDTPNLSPHHRQPPHPCPLIPSPVHSFFQSKMGLGFNQPPRHCSTKHDHPPGFPSPITTPDGGHGILNENQVHTQSNLPAPEIHPVKEEVSELEQAPEPNFNLNPLLHSPYQGQPSHPCPIFPCPIHTFGMDIRSFKQPSRHFPTEEHDHPPGFPFPTPSSPLTHEMGIRSFKQPSRHLPTEEHDHPPGFPIPIPSSTLTPTTNQVPAPDGGHGIQHKNSVHTRSDLPAPDSYPVKKEVSEPKQAHIPNSNHNPLPQTDNIQVLSQVPSQNDKETAKTELGPRGRRRRRSPMRRKSHPYKKYGPYTCSQCHVVFESVHRFAAHYQNHYKDETPAEKKKRHERKTKYRDLRIARCTNGITIMPGSPQVEDEPKAAENKTNRSNAGQKFSSVIIKEEVVIEEE